MRILVVDDEVKNAELTALALRDAGHAAEFVNGASAALERMEASPFDAVVTDLRMPRMDGLELLQHVHGLPDSHRPARVIAISGEYEAGALHGQPVGFIAKPFNLDVLLNMLGGKPN